ncbi:MAG: prepilin-type N-terminal cleavage/methylation domain-containing protein [Verrucomicrobiota bacterium]|nr:prepilin-type N-terminal cleavage/methylation domain-containing protein [Verrucomicrobiota bacterium]
MSAGIILLQRLRVRKPNAPVCGAFTLIEVLVVTAIVALLVGAIGACLAGGFRVWDSARTCNVVDGQAMIALAVLERDLMNGRPFHEIEFRGSPDQLTIPGLAPSRDPGEGPAERLGTIQYTFDPVARSLIRSSWAFPSGARPACDVEKLLAGVSGARFRYWAGPGGADSPAVGEWRKEWRSPTNFPGMVRVDFAFGDDRRSFEISRTFVLPLCPLSGEGGAR